MTANATTAYVTATRAKTPDAIDLLTIEHDEIACLLGECERTFSLAGRKALADQLCLTLLRHAQLEEEILFPAAKLVLKDRLMIATAEVEQATIRGLAGGLQQLDVKDEAHRATATLLARFVTEHIVSEEHGIFRQLRHSAADLAALGGRLAARKAALMQSPMAQG